MDLAFQDQSAYSGTQEKLAEMNAEQHLNPYAQEEQHFEVGEIPLGQKASVAELVEETWETAVLD